MRPGPLPDHGQPGDPSFIALAAVTLTAAFLATRKDFLARLCHLRPLPLHRRLRASVAHKLR